MASFFSPSGSVFVRNLYMPLEIWVTAFGTAFTPFQTDFPNWATSLGTCWTWCLHHGPNRFRCRQHHAQPLASGFTMHSFGTVHRRNFSMSQTKNSMNL